MRGIYICPKRKKCLWTGEAREAILNNDVEKLTEKTGLDNLMAGLSKKYFKMKVLRHMRPMKLLKNLQGLQV